MTDDDDNGLLDAENAVVPRTSADWWSQTDLHELIGTLTAFVRSRYPVTSGYDAEEVATEAILRVMEAAKAGRIQIDGDPTAYLVTVARHVAIDRIRRSVRRSEFSAESYGLESLEDIPADSDSIVKFINRSSAAADINRALSAARNNGDATAFRVITFTLNETERDGRMPSSRYVADHLGLSHTGVAKAMARFRAYVEQTGEADTDV